MTSPLLRARLHLLIAACAATIFAMPQGAAYATSCGDGVVEAGEQCDPPGECCAHDCIFETSGLPCGGADLCESARTAACDGAGTCDPTRAPCDTPETAFVWCAGAITLRDDTPDHGDRLKIKDLVGRGSGGFFPPTPAELGDPSTSTTYAICLYDGAQAVFAAGVAPGPLWRSKGGGWQYRNRQNPNGIGKMLVGSRLRIKGRGEELALPGAFGADEYFDGATPVAVHVVNDRGWCGKLGLGAFGARSNTATSYKYKGR